MVSKMQNPAVGDGRVCEMVLAGALDNSHSIKSLREIQVIRLNRRFALSLPFAALIASLHYGER